MDKVEKDRVIKLGEVKTPEKIVKNILDLIGDLNYKSRYFEPGCGDGNFLTQILDRKILEISKMQETKNHLKNGYFENIEVKLIMALSSIYGVDIDETNIQKCRKRLEKNIFEYYQKNINQDIPAYFINSIKKILKSNIILGDLLSKNNNIVIYEYTEIPTNRVQIREYEFNELLYPDNEIFRDDLKLFGHIPEVKKTHKPVYYKEL